MSKLSAIISKHESDLLSEWLTQQKTVLGPRGQMKSEAEIRNQGQRFLKLLQQASEAGNAYNADAAEWKPVREWLAEISRERARQGYSPAETATFVFSLKRPLFDALRTEFKGNADTLTDETWTANALLDQLGLFTMDVHQKAREEVITRQQEEMMELSTPVIQLWRGILALPLIGTLDSARTQVVMETLLQKIVDTGSSIAIIDITGVPTVDTLVAQHLMKTVAAARLMGADCLISGIRPQIAQTIVHLGVALGDVSTKASLADAFALALKRNNLGVRELSA
jgi:rsbT co-antagonist protein RsbR